MLFEKKTDWPPLQFKTRIIILFLSFILYIILFYISTLIRGIGLPAAATIVIVAVGLLFGLIPGLIAGLLVLPVNILVYMAFNQDWSIVFTIGGIAGYLSLVLIGGIVGYFRDLRLKLNSELILRTQAEKQLQKHRGKLENLVNERTAELLAANEELILSEKRYRSVVDSSVDAIITTNNIGNIIYWNRGAHEIFGYREEDIIGKPGLSLFREDLKTAHQKFLDSPQVNNPPSDFTVRGEGIGIRKNGEEFAFYISSYTWYVEDNPILYAYHSRYDKPQENRGRAFAPGNSFKPD